MALQKNSHIDGGYAWVILLCAFILQGISLGTSLSVGVFYTEWLEYFGESHTATAWVGSINAGSLFLAGPVISFLTRRFGNRNVALCGCIISSLGLLLSSFAQDIWHLYLAYGLVAGIGFSAIFVPCTVICSEYFNKFQPIALAIATSGQSVASLSLPLVVRLLINHYGWRVAIIFVSALCAQSCVLSCLMFPVRFWKGPNMNKVDISIVKSIDSEELTPQKESPGKGVVQYLKNIRFLLFCSNNLLWDISHFIVFVLIIDFASSQGISKDIGPILLLIIGIGSTLARLAIGILGNTLNISKLMLFNISTTVIAITITMFPVFPGFIPLACLCGVYGIGFGCQIGTHVITIIELFGVETLSTTFGINLVFQSIGCISGPPIGGLLYEVTQSYDVSFYFAGCTCFLAVVLTCVIQFKDKKKWNIPS